MRSFHRHFRAGSFVAVLALFATGCNASAGEPANPTIKAFIGPDARLVAHGVPPLAYRITQPGKLAIADRASSAVLATVSVQVAGQQLVIDPNEGTIALKSATNPNSQDLLASDIDPQREYAVYFAPAKQTGLEFFKWPWGKSKAK